MLHRLKEGQQVLCVLIELVLFVLYNIVNNFSKNTFWIFLCSIKHRLNELFFDISSILTLHHFFPPKNIFRLDLSGCAIIHVSVALALAHNIKLLCFTSFHLRLRTLFRRLLVNHYDLWFDLCFFNFR
jgi:hypothetical protein